VLLDHFPRLLAGILLAFDDDGIDLYGSPLHIRIVFGIARPVESVEPVDELGGVLDLRIDQLGARVRGGVLSCQGDAGYDKACGNQSDGDGDEFSLAPWEDSFSLLL